jgi:hypothetical protein
MYILFAAILPELSRHRRLRALALACGAPPFAFGLIRAAQTGTDFRYVWVAFASACGAAATVAAARRFVRTGGVAAGVSAASFIVATLAGALAAASVGTRFGPGMLIVASAFALCFAAGSLVHLLARR